MSIKELSIYAIQCDEPGCKVDTGELGDYSGWGDLGYAEEEWSNCDQQVIHSSIGPNRHYCDEHRKPVCDGCEIQVSSVDDDGLCLICAAKFAKQQPTSPNPEVVTG